MAPANPPPSTFTKQILVVLLSAVLVGMLGGAGTFFYWLAGSQVALIERATAIEGRATRIEEKVDSLLTTRTDQTREQIQQNTRRLEELQGAP